MVLLSAQSKAPGSEAALAELCRVYWYPLYAYLRRRGYGEHDAQDLTQGFLAQLLERRSIQDVAPEKGKFRSFLLASLNYFLADERDRLSYLIAIGVAGPAVALPEIGIGAETRQALLAHVGNFRRRFARRVGCG